MTFGVHLSREVTVLLILNITVFCEECHGLYREGEDATGTLFVEPVHETLLQPVEAIPMRFFAVREAEVLKEALEIEAVIVADVPENGLEVTCTGRLVKAINDLLEAVGDDLVNGTTTFTEIHYLIRTFVIILSVFLLNEIVHIHKELGRSARA